MSIEPVSELLEDIGIETGGVGADARLRATLGLDSVETTELELELGRRYGLKVDLWDAKDYSLGELASLVETSGS
jgi:acyl carrier protein